MDEESKNKLMELVGFGKGQRFADETSQTLTQGIEPALNMVGFTAVGALQIKCG